MSFSRDARNLFGYTPPIVKEDDPSVSPSSLSPRSRLPPDSYLDEITGLRMLLPTGRRQVRYLQLAYCLIFLFKVASGERSFDFGPSCAQTRSTIVEKVLSHRSISPMSSSLLSSPIKSPSAVPLYTRFIPQYQAALKPAAKTAAITVSILTIVALIIHPLLIVFPLAYMYYLYSSTMND